MVWACVMLMLRRGIAGTSRKGRVLQHRQGCSQENQSRPGAQGPGVSYVSVSYVSVSSSIYMSILNSHSLALAFAFSLCVSLSRARSLAPLSLYAQREKR